MENLGETLGPIWYDRHLEQDMVGKIGRNFFGASRELHHELRREHSKEEIEDAKRALQEVTKQIQEITRKLQT
jgi:hypothetical protein